MPQVYGEGNGPLGTAMGIGTFEIFFGDTDAYGAAARPHLQKLLQQRHHVMQQIAHAKKTGQFKGARAKQLKKHLAAINAQIKRLKSGGGKRRGGMRRMGSQRRRMPFRPFRSMMPGRGQSLMAQTPIPQLAPPGALPRLPDTAAQQEPFFYPPTGPGGEGMFDPGAGPEPSPYSYSVEAEPGFNTLVPLDEVEAGEEDISGWGGWGGAWASGPIPTAPVAAFTAAERAGFGDVLLGEGEGIFGAIGDLLEGIGDAFGLDELGDMLVGDTDFGGDDWGKVDPKVLARIEHLKARKKALKAAIKSASGEKRDRLKAELQQVKHALKLARNLRAAQRGAAGKIAAAALGPAGLLASRGGIFRSKKKAARKEAAARKALAKMEKDHVVSRRVMYPGASRRLAWLAEQRRRAALARQRRFVPPGYPPVPGYPMAPPMPGQVPGTYMVPGGSQLPTMPAGGPGYMNQGPMGPAPGDEAGGGPEGDEGGEDDGKGGLIKVGIGILVVGGVIYAVTQGKKGRGPKLSKAERRARRAGMGGPP